ncbi:hypothetical protein RI129_002944 [Pyrocoelia pectoralis]|uniref:Tyr recombinase domain-containing protein n=1 Tax=Pyrocoelia pectoralis TaxID=417401 RepID=A0AAN7ZMN0_9COLE
MSSSSDLELPSDVEEAANVAVGSLIPEKSKDRYAVAYTKFEKWCELKKLKKTNEKVLLAYFESLKTLKASSLWTTYSMLRAELTVRKNIDIKGYTMLLAWLKRRSDGYHAKKSEIFTKENVEKFIKEAEDKDYLFAKVAMLIGIAGACRKIELTFLRDKDVSDEGTFFKITIPETKTHVFREFVINDGNIAGVNFVDLIRKYRNIRPSTVKHDRFFVKYYNEKCGVQPVGINTFGKLPTMIAQYLRLPNAKAYTGHCFRRSSASFLTDSGADILRIKQHGGWKSNNVAEGYVERSLENKKRIANNILRESSATASRVVGQDQRADVALREVGKVEKSIPADYGVILTNCVCNNVTFNIYKSEK